MQLKTILNRVQKFKSFVYESVRWDEETIGRLSLIITVVARTNSRRTRNAARDQHAADSGSARIRVVPRWPISRFHRFG